MKMLLRFLAMLSFLAGSLSQATDLDVTLEAQQYLQGCITAIAVAEVRRPDLTKTLTGNLSCDSPAFEMANSYYGESRSPVVAESQVNLGAGKLEDFRVTVKDISGKVWIGTESNRPKVKPRPPSPDWLQKETASYAARAVLKACLTALAIYQIDVGALEPDWEGSSCADARLKPGVASLEMVNKTLVTLLPGTVEGYRITVWPKSGKPLLYPETPTPLAPPTIEPPAPGELLSQSLWTLTLSALLYLATFKFWSSCLIGAVGWLLAGLAGLGAFVFANDQGEVSSYIALSIVLVLIGSLMFTVPRLAVWWGREAWWVSLGTGLLTPLLAAVLISVLVTGTSLGLSLPTGGEGFSALSLLPLLSLAFAVWGVWRHARTLPLP